MGNQGKEKSVLVRFNEAEWKILEEIRISYGVRTRGNLIRFLLMSRLKEDSSQ